MWLVDSVDDVIVSGVYRPVSVRDNSVIWTDAQGREKKNRWGKGCNSLKCVIPGPDVAIISVNVNSVQDVHIVVFKCEFFIGCPHSCL